MIMLAYIVVLLPCSHFWQPCDSPRIEPALQQGLKHTCCRSLPAGLLRWWWQASLLASSLHCLCALVVSLWLSLRS